MATLPPLPTIAPFLFSAATLSFVARASHATQLESVTRKVAVAVVHPVSSDSLVRVMETKVDAGEDTPCIVHGKRSILGDSAVPGRGKGDIHPAPTPHTGTPAFPNMLLNISQQPSVYRTSVIRWM